MPRGYQGFDHVALERNLQTTMQELRRDVEDASKRNYQMLALMDANGRVTYNHSGEGISWPVQYRHHRAEGATGENPRNFARTNLWKTAALDYRGYEVTDSIARREMLKNRGESAIINVINGFVERMKQSLIHELGPQFYVDGNDPANSKFWHGMDTLIKTNGETIANDGSGPRAKDAADRVAVPHSSYADLSMVLGNYGGEQKGTDAWPEGVADSEYDFWSPLIINRESTEFNFSGTDTSGEILEHAMRYGLTHGQRNATMEGQLSNIWLDRSLYIDVKNVYDKYQRIETTSGSSLRSFGFLNNFIFDGIEVSWETATPVGYGYGININNIELMSLTENLYVDEGPEYSIETQTFNAAVSTLSNFKFTSPRNFAFWVPFAAI